MILALALCSVLTPWLVGSSPVLDPALFLLPSPPFSPNIGEVTAEDRWRGVEQRVERDAIDLSVVPLEQETETTPPPESMEKAETFWPSLRSANYGIRALHVPLTFAVSGHYGNYGSPGGGVIASSYGNAELVGGGFMGTYGKSALAGSSYSSYSLPVYQGTRVYGSGGSALWSGWGNGKWGHYGKG